MKEQLEQRLRELTSEFEAGQKMLAELEAKQANLRETLLRISGAIQVLQEMLSANSSAQENHEVTEPQKR
jgi:predicted nuclease with TOPRIM domain